MLNEQSNNGKGDDVEESDTPENLLNSRGEGLAGIGGFGSGQANQLGSSESESCRNKHTTEALEPVIEGSGVVPVCASYVSTLWSTPTVNDDA